MSRIVVFGAGGAAGRLISAEAAARGHEVIAVTRRPVPGLTFPDGVRVVAGDATSEASVRSVAEGADAVVLAVGGPGRALWRDAAAAVVGALGGLPEPRPRVIHMGGGATLTTPDGTRFLELPTFPEAYLDPATGQAAALDYYLTTDGAVPWTYISPPPVDFRRGERTGGYRTGGDQPVLDSAGESRLSYEDFAVVVVDEIETPKHPNQRFTAAY